MAESSTTGSGRLRKGDHADAFSPKWLPEHPEEYERLLAQRLIAPTPPEAWRAQFAACAGYLSKGAPKGAG